MIRIDRPRGSDWVGVALLAAGPFIAGTARLMLTGLLDPVLAVACVVLVGLCMSMVGRELWHDLVSWRSP